MEIIIASVLMVFIMMIFSMYIFKIVIKRINQSAKTWFLNKIQDYNYLIEEQKQKLDNLREEEEKVSKKIGIIEQIEEIKSEKFDDKIEEVLIKMKNFKNIQTEDINKPEIIYDIPIPEYKEASFFNNYKQLVEKFDVDCRKIIKEFIEKNPKDKSEHEYNILSNFCNNFNNKNLYECSTLQNELQFELIEEILTEEEKKFIKIDEKTMNINEFTIRGLIEELKERIKILDPAIYIYVGRNGTNYEDIDPRIKTYRYKNMSEGIIIHYKGKMYDYSI